MRSRITQTSDILNYMRENGFITSKIANELFGATRLAAIIFNLRKVGYEIETILVDGTTRYGTHTQYAKYYLRGEKKC